MERSELLIVQKDFVKVNRFVFLVITAYAAERRISEQTVFSLVPLVLLLAFLIMETLLLSRKNIPVFWITGFRYLQSLTALLVLVDSSYVYTFAIALLCFGLFATEYYLSVDFVDPYFRNICVISIVLPMTGGILMDTLIRGTVNSRLLPLVFVTLVYSIILTHISDFFSGLVIRNEKRVLAQTRLTEKVKETNEALFENQNKLKKTNELLGIQKLQLEEANNKIKRVNSEMMIQNEIVKYISSSLEIGKLMALITESIIDVIGVDVCSIVLYPENEEEDIRYKVTTKLNARFAGHLRQAVQEQCFEPYIGRKETYIDNHVKESNYSFIENGAVGSLIIVPLMKNQETSGALFVGHPRYDYFTENILFFEAIVAQFMIALNNANLYSRMRYMANRDGLTGIYNRRYLTKLYNEALNESIISRTPLSVVLFDIDKFKNINDSYGHIFGDIVIKTIASLSEKIAKENGGKAGRYGGEEFVLLFQDKGINDVYDIVNHLLECIRETELVHNLEPIHVTVSIGITSYPETCKNPSELLNRADWAMYYSKENGRDCITVDEEDIRENVMLKQ